MELVFEMVGTRPLPPGYLSAKTFRQAGGVIGRSAHCDWVLPDPRRLVSGTHAEVSWRDGAFHLTDTSSNGTRLRGGERLPQGAARRIEHGDVFCLGDFEIRARLRRDPTLFDSAPGLPMALDALIPDDVPLDLDPLNALQQQERLYAETDALLAPLRPAAERDQAPLEHEVLHMPTLVLNDAALPSPPASVTSSDFWLRFAAALGEPLDARDEAHCQRLAIAVATLLRQTLTAVDQGLNTRDALHRELGLSTAPSDRDEAMPADLSALLAEPAGAALTVQRRFRQLQAHQVALFAAARATCQSVLEQLAPKQVVASERHPLLATAGARWRNYRRRHQRLLDQGGEQLFVTSFAHFYEEQRRLLAALDSDRQG